MKITYNKRVQRPAQRGPGTGRKQRRNDVYISAGGQSGSQQTCIAPSSAQLARSCPKRPNRILQALDPHPRGIQRRSASLLCNLLSLLPFICPVKIVSGPSPSSARGLTSGLDKDEQGAYPSRIWCPPRGVANNTLTRHRCAPPFSSRYCHHRALMAKTPCSRQSAGWAPAS
jgi:hypothetical protein